MPDGSVAAVVDAVFDASHRRDMDAVLALFAEDGVWDLVPLRTGRGRNQIEKLMAPIFATISAMEIVVTRQVEVGSVLFHERIDRFEVNGSWQEIPVAGVFEVEDGKIRLWRDYFDLKSWERQLAGG